MPFTVDQVEQKVAEFIDAQDSLVLAVVVEATRPLDAGLRAATAARKEALKQAFLNLLAMIDYET
jgi:hypothetical protein